jgi:hypothetical protein
LIHEGVEALQARITELERELSALRADDARLRLSAIVESSEDAIVGKDLDGIIRSWNKGAEIIFGYTAEEAIGQHVSMLAAPERVDEIPNILERIGRGEKVEHYETRRRAKDGSIVRVSVSISPIRNARGQIIGAAKIARDITEQQRVQDRLREMNAALARANKDLEQLAYSASHDLQEPARNVAVFVELLEQRLAGKVDEKSQECLEIIRKSALRMNVLVRDLLDYTKLSEVADVPSATAEAAEAVEEALESLAQSIRENRAEIIVGPLPKLKMQGKHLVQLFTNLVSNALKYRSEQTPRIHISARRQGGHWLFSVQDNGIGIEPQYTEVIFKLFKRLHTAEAHPGSGIGLSICQNVVQRYGGQIWVDSEWGRGSTFQFTLPEA